MSDNQIAVFLRYYICSPLFITDLQRDINLTLDNHLDEVNVLLLIPQPPPPHHPSPANIIIKRKKMPFKGCTGRGSLIAEPYRTETIM